MGFVGWKVELQELLVNGMRYCFKPVDGRYPELDEDELVGSPEEAGFLDRLEGLVNDLRKKAFYRAYELGARDAALDGGFEFDAELSRYGASKAWEEMEAE